MCYNDTYTSIVHFKGTDRKSNLLSRFDRFNQIPGIKQKAFGYLNG